MWAPLANAAWFATALPDALAFRRACGRVRATQEAVLRRIIRANRTTAFGRWHAFESIGSVADFQRRVAISTYDDFADAVQQIAGGANGILTSERVTHLVPTSGSTAAPRLIPYTPALLGEYQHAIAPWIVSLFTRHPALAGGSAYWSVTPLLQRPQQTSSGIPIGFESDDAYLGGLRRRLVRAIQAVPPAVARIRDLDTFRYVTLFFLASHADLTLISVWNPTFLMLLLEPLAAWSSPLAGDIAAGRISRLHAASADSATVARLQRDAMRRRSVRRGAEISKAMQHPDAAKRHAALWPRLRLISCWADAEAAAQLADLRRDFPDVSLQPKGLLSTEAFVSIPMGDPRGAALAVRSHFFELREAGSGAVRLAGERYEVVVTTGGGLYRYATGDHVEVTGMMAGCPLLRFTGRGTSISDHFGEKLSEAHVAAALREALPAAGRVRFAMVARDEPHPARPAYALFIESDLSDEEVRMAAAAIDDNLQANVHYRYCRQLGQLSSLRAFRLRGDGKKCFLSASAGLGQRLGDVKPRSLHPASGWSQRLEGEWV